MRIMFERLKSLREDRNLKQREIAKALGVARSTYAGWETNLNQIPLERLNDICNFLNTNMDYIANISNIKINDKTNYKIDKNEIGKKLKEIRNKNDDKQHTISKTLGLANSSYAAAERGENFIQTDLLIAFCKHYNISMDYICGRSDNKEIQNK